MKLKLYYYNYENNIKKSNNKINNDKFISNIETI